MSRLSLRDERGETPCLLSLRLLSGSLSPPDVWVHTDVLQGASLTGDLWAFNVHTQKMRPVYWMHKDLNIFSKGTLLRSLCIQYTHSKGTGRISWVCILRSLCIQHEIFVQSMYTLKRNLIFVHSKEASYSPAQSHCAFKGALFVKGGLLQSLNAQRGL